MIDRQHNSICDLGWGWKFAPKSYSDLAEQGEV
jgi:hypothetical protein